MSGLNISIRVAVLSLSARRAWIEMQISVSTVVGVLGRSPQGERG